MGWSSGLGQGPAKGGRGQIGPWDGRGQGQAERWAWSGFRVASRDFTSHLSLQTGPLALSLTRRRKVPGSYGPVWLQRTWKSWIFSWPWPGVGRRTLPVLLAAPPLPSGTHQCKPTFGDWTDLEEQHMRWWAWQLPLPLSPVHFTCLLYNTESGWAETQNSPVWTGVL